jgi:hypothetical protein
VEVFFARLQTELVKFRFGVVEEKPGLSNSRTEETPFSMSEVVKGRRTRTLVHQATERSLWAIKIMVEWEKTWRMVVLMRVSLGMEEVISSPMTIEPD